MEKTNKNSKAYIQKLEDKIVDLSLELKTKNNAINTLKKENYEYLKKLTHNLKNPVGVAFSFSEMIAENTQKISKEKLDQYTEIIQNSAKFSLETLNAVATLNRLKEPEFCLNHVTVNYVDFLDEILNGFIAEFQQKNIVLIKKFNGSNLLLSIDTIEMKLAISNLVSNALRFSPKNSTITISVYENNDTIETIISDQGIGISESDNLHVFNPFFVVNTYCVYNQKCIGLGLTIAKIIVNYHKGSIHVSSNLDQGVSFKITLPKK